MLHLESPPSTQSSRSGPPAVPGAAVPKVVIQVWKLFDSNSENLTGLANAALSGTLAGS